MDPAILRGIERLLGVMVGGLAIYLGYRLFLHLPRKTDSSGKVVLPGGVNIFLSRIGPGAFFALFGAGVVAVSFQKPVQFTALSAPPSASPNNVTLGAPLASTFIGAGGAVGSAEDVDREPRRAEAAITIANLNELFATLRPTLSATRRIDADRALRETKFALIRDVWDRKWGDQKAFQAWVLAGEKAPMPTTFDEPRQLYHQGEKP